MHTKVLSQKATVVARHLHRHIIRIKSHRNNNVQLDRIFQILMINVERTSLFWQDQMKTYTISRDLCYFALVHQGFPLFGAVSVLAIYKSLQLDTHLINH